MAIIHVDAAIHVAVKRTISGELPGFGAMNTYLDLDGERETWKNGLGKPTFRWDFVRHGHATYTTETLGCQIISPFPRIAAMHADYVFSGCLR